MSLPVKSLPAPGSRISLWIEWASEVLCEIPEGGKKEARLLLSELLSDPIAPWTKDREVLPVTLSERYQDWVDRRSRREPFHLITGSVPFMDARFEVAPGVLLPRPETESVVESVLDFLDCRAPSCILDLGCGCGILGITFLKKFSQARCLSVDFMETPLDLTAKNALLHGVNDRMHLIRGDWTEMIRPSRRFDLVVSNPPYIPSEVIPGLAPEIVFHEPRAALDGGPDGLTFYRRFLESLPGLLNSGGVAAVEIGGDQGWFFRTGESCLPGLSGPWIHQDVSGLDRVVLWMKG